ncbi:hypothetical protein [Arcanobacterium pinnipediorum]|uniref:Uncharacterized protein n=1 Tax=Arcanobacterium pinnipediorum TaxID=1503041 RepID=A0ABY5AIC7_9ACTO|nr:hypothetical protein [Arcanobacterium pinnipediorum]USR79750.1 hypothetical protein NG665_01805 [Arcanobacterium pinnipediorum]
MRIKVVKKSLGKTRPLSEIPYYLQSEVNTLHDLIAALVEIEVAAFLQKPETVALTQPELAGMLETGKVWFGDHENEGEVVLSDAIDTALQAVEDGLVKIFLNDAEIIGLDSKISLAEDDRLVLLKLTFLTGRY